MPWRMHLIFPFVKTPVPLIKGPEASHTKQKGKRENMKKGLA
jgi:hypothetical protein